MKIGLFDLYASGHHLPYANRIRNGLESVSDSDVTFVTLSETDGCAEYFDSDDIAYIDDPDSPPIEQRAGEFTGIAESAMREFLSGGKISDYDVVHFLYTDDILGPLWRLLPSVDGPRLIGEVNGVFFKRGTVLRSRYLHPLLLRLLESPARTVLDSAVPQRSRHESLWRDLFLYRCLRSSVFNRLLVHSIEADEYVSRLNPRDTTSVDHVPYPGPSEFGMEITRSEAREQLDLDPDASILLYFGTLRQEKGIHRLLEALRRYRGPRFTMLIAGPPVSVSESNVREASRNTRVKILTELEFISNPEPYYRAADAVILPYLWEFGRECTSQSHGEACSAMRPVIVPDFGAIGRCTEEWELGVTYQQGSVESLTERLRLFANSGIPYSDARMKQYNRRHSSDRLATELLGLYESSGE